MERREWAERDRDERGRDGERECVRREKIIKYNFLVLDIVMFNRSATSTTLYNKS